MMLRFWSYAEAVDIVAFWAPFKSFARCIRSCSRLIGRSFYTECLLANLLVDIDKVCRLLAFDANVFA